jgi:WD40 repeat protein
MNRVRGSSVAIDDDNTIVSGWKDGFIRAFTITNKPISPLKWEIVNAHKGSVTSVYADRNYYISAGEDGLVRMWTKASR